MAGADRFPVGYDPQTKGTARKPSGGRRRSSRKLTFEQQVCALARYYSTDPLNWTLDEWNMYSSGMGQYESIIRPRSPEEISAEAAAEKIKAQLEARKRKGIQ